MAICVSAKSVPTPNPFCHEVLDERCPLLAGTYPAIDAANAACERQFQALAVVTNISEAGSVMIQVIEAAKNGALDDVRPHP